MKRLDKPRKWLIKKLGGYTSQIEYPAQPVEIKTVPTWSIKLGARFFVYHGYEDYGAAHAKRILCEKLAERLSALDVIEIYKTDVPDGIEYHALLTVVIPEDKYNAEV